MAIVQGYIAELRGPGFRKSGGEEVSNIFCNIPARMFQGLVWQHHCDRLRRNRSIFFFFFFFLSIESWLVDRLATMLEFPVNGSATVSSYIFFSTFVEIIFVRKRFVPTPFRFYFIVLHTFSSIQYLHLRNIGKIVQRVVSLYSKFLKLLYRI